MLTISYSLIYTKSSLKDIKKLDSVVKKKLKKKLELLATNPFHYSKKLIHSDLGTYRYRISNHRVIFDIEKNNIIILRIGHRREIYR